MSKVYLNHSKSSSDVIKTQIECMIRKSNLKTEFRKDSCAVSNLKSSNMFQAAQILNLKAMAQRLSIKYQ